VVDRLGGLSGGGRLMIDSGLVFDVGANTGEDTAAFLARGLRVVAVETNPKLCADMRARFADEISDGRLVVVDKAISGRKTVILHLNSADSGWGAASASYAARGQAVAGKIERIEIETTTLTEIIRTHGSPRYVKIDIEGADILCLLGLFHADPPPFISLERPASLGEQRFAFNLLRRLGYTRFQIVDQTKVPEQRHPILVFRRGDIGLFGAELPEGAWMRIVRASALNCWIVLRSGVMRRISGRRRSVLKGRSFHIHAERPSDEGHRVAEGGSAERHRSDRQRDLPDKAGENEHAAEAVALALIRQEQATEADERGERHSDLTSSVHLSFPQLARPMNLGCATIALLACGKRSSSAQGR
jgi:FkbM family methyltransferase